MPVQSWGHSHYWAGPTSSQVGPPNVPIYITSGYPSWQGGVVLASGFGGVGARLAVWWVQWRWLWRFGRRVQALAAPDRVVVERVIGAMETPVWPLAQASVARTAHTLGFNRPEAWIALHRMLKHDHVENENRFRHLEACRLLRGNLVTSTLSNPECHLMVELAYHRYTVRP